MKKKELNIEEIKDLIPHRYPFLLIDRLIDIIPDTSATGIKNVTFNENFFQGHFESMSVMPGALIIESMAQSAGTLVMFSLKKKSKNTFFNPYTCIPMLCTDIYIYIDVHIMNVRNVYIHVFLFITVLLTFIRCSAVVYGKNTTWDIHI